MPGVIAHHLFGQEMLDALGRDLGLRGGARDAFLLGNMGPDPFFCLKILPLGDFERNIGSTLHAKRTDDLLCAFHDRFVRPSSDVAAKEQGILKAYALGMLCHYILDSTVHPLVFAQQLAYCSAGIEGLDRQHGYGATHALIETEYDEYLLYAKRGQTVADFVPHKEVMHCAPSHLNAISARFADVVEDAYSKRVGSFLFGASVHMYRAAQHSLDSKRAGIRRRFDYARIIGKPYLHILAMTHDDCRREHTVFANDEHFGWKHAHDEGVIVSESLDELYERASAAAVRALPQFASCDFGRESCEELTGGVNFVGAHVRKL